MESSSKSKALKRAILRFVPKKKRGFLDIGSCVYLANHADSFYKIPFLKGYVKDYLISEKGLEIRIDLFTKKNPHYYVTRNPKYIYHSILDFTENNYDLINNQISDIQQNFAFNQIITINAKNEARLTLRQLLNIRRKVDKKRRKKLPPNIQIPII